jgi:putative glycosyltransferase (TIGR04372 family)
MSNPSTWDNPYGRFYNGIGTWPDRPFKILLPMMAHSFGDVFILTACAARFATAFDHTHCSFLIDGLRPFTPDIVRMYPYPCSLFKVAGEWRDIEFLALAGLADKMDWRAQNYHDFILTTAFLSSGVASGYPACPLRIPEAMVPTLKQHLISRGLDPTRWFCTIHWREPTYAFKLGTTFRDVDPGPYHRLIDYVIDHLGGQVVQLGHPELTRHAPRQGLIDLSALPNSWLLQAYAVSRSRFFAGSASAGSAMSFALQVPAAHLNATDWYVGEAEDWVLTPTVVLRDGRRLRQVELYRSGWMNSVHLQRGLELGEVRFLSQPETPEILAVATRIHESTCAVTGWREPASPIGPRPNRIPTPTVPQDPPRFLEI